MSPKCSLQTFSVVSLREESFSVTGGQNVFIWEKRKKKLEMLFLPESKKKGWKRQKRKIRKETVCERSRKAEMLGGEAN